MGFLIAAVCFYVVYALGYRAGVKRAAQGQGEAIYWRAKFFEMKRILDTLIHDIRSDMEAIGFGVADRAQSDLAKLERIKMP